ncbi:MAG: LytTR family DNA-binding domain-containing protein [Bacillota bacterium]|nr:LytTR family DNA-binding domain-containing protein [Bacillota bacterium]
MAAWSVSVNKLPVVGHLRTGEIFYNDSDDNGGGSPAVGVRLRFVKDSALGEDIEITVCAKEKNERVEKLLSVLSEHSRQLVSSLQFSEKYHVNSSSVILIMRDGRYVTAKTVEGDYTIKDALARVEESLDPAWFVRISQSEIINLRYLKNWDFVGGGIIQVKMEYGIVSYTSRRYAKQIHEMFLKWRAKR